MSTKTSSKAHKRQVSSPPTHGNAPTTSERYYIQRELIDELDDLGRGVSTTPGELDRPGGVKTLGVSIEGISSNRFRQSTKANRRDARRHHPSSPRFAGPPLRNLRIIYLKGIRSSGTRVILRGCPASPASLSLLQASSQNRDRAERLGADGFISYNHHPGVRRPLQLPIRLPVLISPSRTHQQKARRPSGNVQGPRYHRLPESVTVSSTQGTCPERA